MTYTKQWLYTKPTGAFNQYNNNGMKDKFNTMLGAGDIKSLFIEHVSPTQVKITTVFASESVFNAHRDWIQANHSGEIQSFFANNNITVTPIS